jgi:hypothetical protein
LGTVSPEKHHRRFQYPSAPRATWDSELVEIRIVQIGVAVRTGHRRQRGEGGIIPLQRALHLGARSPDPARQADHGIEPAVQIDHPPAAGLLVQTIDVLGHQLMDETCRFQSSQRGVSGIGLGTGKGRPAKQTACPVTLSSPFTGHELLVAHRLAAFPVAVAIAIIGNAGIGAATGAGQHEQPRMACDEISQGVWRIGTGRGVVGRMHDRDGRWTGELNWIAAGRRKLRVSAMRTGSVTNCQSDYEYTMADTE